MKRIFFLGSLFVAVCFAVVSLAVTKRNAFVSFQMENMEALTFPNSIPIWKCYMNVPLISGTGIFISKCNPSTNSGFIYPCHGSAASTAGVYVESLQSYASDQQICFVSPE
jgi:hypothetical protein